MVVVPKDDPSNIHDLGASGGWSFCEFTRAHGIEPGANEEVSNDGGDTVLECGLAGTGGGVQMAKESWSDCLLAVGEVCIVKGAEQGADGGIQDGAVWDVNRAWFMMVPKCHNQMACGIIHSAADHRHAMVSGKCTIGIPGGIAVELEE